MTRRSCRSRRGFEPWRSPADMSLFLYYTLFSDVLVSVKVVISGKYINLNKITKI